MRNRNIMFTTILLALGLFALLPGVQAAPATPDIPAVTPRGMQLPATPDPGGVGGSFNTADGANALGSVTTGVANSAFGWFSLFSNTDGSFNTAVGAGTLLFNIGDQAGGLGLENTAVGTAALLFNNTGSFSTAIGTAALLNNIDGSGTAIGRNALRENTSGSANTATGFNAMIANTTGFNNAAYGVRPMESNVDGINNTALGNLALQSSQSTSDHVCVGRLAGSGITTANNNVIIGHNSGVHPDPGFGEISDRCFIDNIHGAPVSSNFDPQIVLVDSAGRLGTAVLAGADTGGFFPNSGLRPATLQGAHNAMLNRKVEELQATIAQHQKQIEALTSGLQRVSAQLETRKPAAKVVLNNP
jgi:hypothetical protein